MTREDQTIVRVLLGILRTAERMERRGDDWRAVLQMHRILGRLMAANGIGLGEL